MGRGAKGLSGDKYNNNLSNWSELNSEHNIRSYAKSLLLEDLHLIRIADPVVLVNNIVVIEQVPDGSANLCIDPCWKRKIIFYRKVNT